MEKPRPRNRVEIAPEGGSERSLCTSAAYDNDDLYCGRTSSVDDDKVCARCVDSVPLSCCSLRANNSDLHFFVPQVSKQQTPITRNQTPTGSVCCSTLSHRQPGDDGAWTCEVLPPAQKDLGRDEIDEQRLESLCNADDVVDLADCCCCCLAAAVGDDPHATNDASCWSQRNHLQSNDLQLIASDEKELRQRAERGKCHRKRHSEPHSSASVTYAKRNSSTPHETITSSTSCYLTKTCTAHAREGDAKETSSASSAHRGNELESSSESIAKYTTAEGITGEVGTPSSCLCEQTDEAKQTAARVRNKQVMGEVVEAAGQSRKIVQPFQASNDRKKMAWKSLAQRYGGQVPQNMSTESLPTVWLGKMRRSCLCHLFTSTIYYLFPILSSFKNYSLPSDLITDLTTGFTIAVLHIPQGMAYGMLANVDPIYGLYVSFVPVVVMSLMSKSRHVSYGTFAIISMLLAHATESTKLAIKRQAITDATQQQIPTGASASSPINELGALIMTDNHQPLDESQKMMRNLFVNQQPTLDDRPIMITATNFSRSGADARLLVEGRTAEVVLPTNIEILTCICLVVGLIQVAMALARLGLLSLLFSDQLVSSFTSASAVHVMTSQLGGLFDQTLPQVPEGPFKIFRVWAAYCERLYSEGCNQYTGALTIMSMIFLISIKQFVEPAMQRRYKTSTCLPSELVLMIVLILSSWFWQFSTNYDILIVGSVPTGLPPLRAPRLDLAPWVVQDSITIALVSFAMNLSLAQVYAKKYKYVMDPNAELFALGTSNIVGSFYQCFPCASSLSRSAVQSNLDAKSPICSLFSCVIVASILCYFAPVLYNLPRSTLSCIIIVALKGILIQIKDLAKNWRQSKTDATVWIVTFAAVLELGVTYGLLVGIVASLAMIIFR